MNLGNQVKQVMMCIEQKVYFDKKNKFFPKSLAGFGIIVYLCPR